MAFDSESQGIFGTDFKKLKINYRKSFYATLSLIV